MDQRRPGRYSAADGVGQGPDLGELVLHREPNQLEAQYRL
jgi:hypothetical protein